MASFVARDVRHGRCHGRILGVCGLPLSEQRGVGLGHAPHHRVLERDRLEGAGGPPRNERRPRRCSARRAERRHDLRMPYFVSRCRARSTKKPLGSAVRGELQLEDIERVHARRFGLGRGRVEVAECSHRPRREHERLGPASGRVAAVAARGRRSARALRGGAAVTEVRVLRDAEFGARRARIEEAARDQVEPPAIGPGAGRAEEAQRRLPASSGMRPSHTGGCASTETAPSRRRAWVLRLRRCSRPVVRHRRARLRRRPRGPTPPPAPRTRQTRAS